MESLVRFQRESAAVVRNNVCHRDFPRQFQHQIMLNPMVRELTYNNLVIVNGMVAAVEIARLLLCRGNFRPTRAIRHALIIGILQAGHLGSGEVEGFSVDTTEIGARDAR